MDKAYLLNDDYVIVNTEVDSHGISNVQIETAEYIITNVEIS